MNEISIYIQSFCQSARTGLKDGFRKLFTKELTGQMYPGQDKENVKAYREYLRRKEHGKK